MKLLISIFSFLVFSGILNTNKLFANSLIDTCVVIDTLCKGDYISAECPIQPIEIFPCTVRADSLKPYKHENKKLIAAILAFPFPFGMLGLHRLYLGTKPYMPFVYIGTVGGCLFILPLIDFCAILVANHEQLQHFESNPKVFMWSH